MRGSPHAHCLLWVKDAPKIDKDPDDDVCTFIDKYITAVIPPVAPENEHDIKLMDNLQKDTFWLLLQKQILLFWFSETTCNKNLNILMTCWWSGQKNGKCKITVTTCAKHTYNADVHNKSTQCFLQEINSDIETYMDALKISQRGPNVILKWNPQDVFINACNHAILSLWRGNVDLQYVINEIATVKYVCGYMTKGEKGMGETLKRVAKVCWKHAIWTQMNKIKKEFLAKWVLRGTRISNVSVVNVANEKQEGCISWYKYERWTCESTKTKVTTHTVTWWWWCFLQQV